MIVGNHNRMHATSRAAWKLQQRFFEVVYEPFHAGVTRGLLEVEPRLHPSQAQFRPALPDLLSEAGGAREAIRPVQLAWEPQGLLQQTPQRGVQVMKGRSVPVQDEVLHRPHKLRKRQRRALR